MGMISREKIEEHHKILGLSYPTTPEQLKKAKKDLAIKWHPDKNLGDKCAEKMMQDIFYAHDELVKFYKDNAYRKFMDAAGVKREAPWKEHREKEAARKEYDAWVEYEKNPQKFAEDLFTDLFHPGRRRRW